MEPVEKDGGLPPGREWEPESIGLKTYDWALPIQFYEPLFRRAGVNLSGEVVWCYDGSTFGYPVPLSRRAAWALSLRQ